jgi:hypothetical protein
MHNLWYLFIHSKSDNLGGTKLGLYWGRCGSLLVKQHAVYVQGSSMIDLRFPFFQIDFMWALQAKHAIYINKLHIPQAPFLCCLNPKLWNGRSIQYLVDIFGQQCCPLEASALHIQIHSSVWPYEGYNFNVKSDTLQLYWNLWYRGIPCIQIYFFDSIYFLPEIHIWQYSLWIYYNTELHTDCIHIRNIQYTTIRNYTTCRNSVIEKTMKHLKTERTWILQQNKGNVSTESILSNF